MGAVTPGNADRFYGLWNVTSFAGKEPELMMEMEWYQLDIVRFSSPFTQLLCDGS